MKCIICNQPFERKPKSKRKTCGKKCLGELKRQQSSELAKNSPWKRGFK